MNMFKRALVISTLAISGIASAADYEMDVTHTFPQFIAGHLGFSYTVGQFNEFSGSFQINEDPSTNTAEMVIQTASLDSNHAKRDEHLRSPDFFDVKQFPTITFKSTAYEGTNEQGKLIGDMTMLGQTRSVTFDIVKVGEGDDPWGGYRYGAVATTTIDRTDFGMDYFVPGVPAEVELKVYIEGIRQ